MFQKSNRSRTLWMILMTIPSMLLGSLFTWIFLRRREANDGMIPSTGGDQTVVPTLMEIDVIETSPVREPQPLTNWQVAPEWTVAPGTEEQRSTEGPRSEEKHAVKRMNRWGFVVLLIPFVLLLAAIIANAALAQTQVAPFRVLSGNPVHGQQAIVSYGCVACHTIPGVTGANAGVGPSLSSFSKRSFIAGQLPNTPDNVIAWIMHPQQVKPGTAMPDMGVSFNDARDIAAYLYTLR